MTAIPDELQIKNNPTIAAVDALRVRGAGQVLTVLERDSLDTSMRKAKMRIWTDDGLEWSLNDPPWAINATDWTEVLPTNGTNGTNGVDGINAFTTAGTFVQPAVLGTVTISVLNSLWMAVGQTIYVETGGYYTVVALPSSVTVTLRNTGATGNTTPGITIAAAQRLSPAGASPGLSGANGTNGTNGVGLFLAHNVLVSGASTGTVSTVVYTVPSTPWGNGRAIITGVLLRLKTQLGGGGSNSRQVGLTVFGQEFIRTATFDSMSPLGQVDGLTLLQLGTSFVSADGYNATLNAGQQIIVTLTATGANSVSSVPTFECDVLGWLVGT